MREKNNVEETALAITRNIGSPASIAIHTLLFVGCFSAAFAGFIEFDRMLLILTTLVSLEAIYLAIFIQMTINYTTRELAEVSQDVEEIQHDVGEIQEDVGEIQEDVEEISEEVEEISEDVEEMNEEEESEEKDEEQRKMQQKQTLEVIQQDLRKLLDDVERLKSVRP
jgi:septal ring factor EnvC (AmiA/AmiB activator)